MEMKLSLLLVVFGVFCVSTISAINEEHSIGGEYYILNVYLLVYTFSFRKKRKIREFRIYLICL